MQWRQAALYLESDTCPGTSIAEYNTEIICTSRADLAKMSLDFFQVSKSILVPPEAVLVDPQLLGTNLLRQMTSLDLQSFGGKSQVVVPSRGY